VFLSQNRLINESLVSDCAVARRSRARINGVISFAEKCADGARCSTVTDVVGLGGQSVLQGSATCTAASLLDARIRPWGRTGL